MPRSLQACFGSLLILICTVASTAQDIQHLLPTPRTAYNHPDTTRFAFRFVTIAVPDSCPPAIDHAVSRFEHELARRASIQTQRVSLEYYFMNMHASQRGIVFVPDTSAFFASVKPILLAHGEAEPELAGGYVLDIRPTEALILCRSTDESAANAVATVLQLLRNSDSTLPCCHVWDEPDYSNRWVFSQHNMLVAATIKTLHDIADTMATYKLDGLYQNDFKLGILDRMFQPYFSNVDSLKAIWAERSIDVIPGVCDLGWSANLMSIDPQLAEGVEARTRYVIEADTGRLLPNPNAQIPNGGFEQVNSSGAFSGYSYYDPCFEQDLQHAHSGAASAYAATVPSGTNARFIRSLSLKPHEYYSLSVWIKTQDISASEIKLLVMADTGNGQFRPVTFTALSIPSTSDWTKAEVFFNTLDYSSVNVYAGAWGVNSGSIWLDDFRIQPAGLCNVLRRSGTPLSVHSLDGSREYTEGVDYLSIHDPWWNSNGENIGPFHTPPTVMRNTSSALHNGDTVEISYYHPFASVSDNQGNGSIMVCVSDDSLYSILHRQISSVDALFHPTKYFMGHDEIRNLNRDAACLKRGLSPAQLLADNMHRCDSLLHTVAPMAEHYMWSDMLDSLHNAVNNYYLVNGDLRGIWDMAPKNTVVVNWNSGKKAGSLDFFARHGYDQMTAPFFSSGNSADALAWRQAQDNIGGVRGMMYTTWTNDYSNLKKFAYYAWGAGAYIIHTPLDSTCFAAPQKITVTITPDPFQTSDAVTGAELVITKTSESLIPQNMALTKVGTSQWTVDFTAPDVQWFRYIIRARTKEGFLRQIPEYEVRRSVDTVTEVNDPEEATLMRVSPQPASTHAEIELLQGSRGVWTVRLVNVLGQTVWTQSGMADGQAQRLRVDCQPLADGCYQLEAWIQGTRVRTPVVVDHR